MSKTGRVIQEMEEFGIEPVQENLNLYLKLKKAQEKYLNSSRVSRSSENNFKEKIKKV